MVSLKFEFVPISGWSDIPFSNFKVSGSCCTGYKVGCAGYMHYVAHAISRHTDNNDTWYPILQAKTCTKFKFQDGPSGAIIIKETLGLPQIATEACETKQ